jgi:chromosomal replication initiation ATPase DnaA
VLYSCTKVEKQIKQDMELAQTLRQLSDRLNLGDGR